MKHLILLVSLIMALSFQVVRANDDHDHGKPHSEEVKKTVKKEEKDHQTDENEHKEHEVEGSEHAQHDEHEEGEGHEEENSQVGPGKGIVEADKSKGFKLSPEAEKNFELEKVKFVSATISIPKSAIVTSGEEVNLFRLREGFYSRIDFIELNSNGNSVTVKSNDLKSGDEIVIKGTGFLRMTEIAAFDGAPAGHSH